MFFGGFPVKGMTEMLVYEQWWAKPSDTVARFERNMDFKGAW
jgi:hypothetical protein